MDDGSDREGAVNDASNREGAVNMAKRIVYLGEFSATDLRGDRYYLEVFTEFHDVVTPHKVGTVRRGTVIRTQGGRDGGPPRKGQVPDRRGRHRADVGRPARTLGGPRSVPSGMDPRIR